MAVAVFGVITLALIAGGYGFYRVAADKIREENHQALAAIGELKSNQIQQWRKERQQDAERMAQSVVTRKVVEDFLRQPDAAKPRADLRGQLQAERDVEQTVDVLLFAPGGAFLLAANDASAATRTGPPASHHAGPRQSAGGDLRLLSKSPGHGYD